MNNKIRIGAGNKTFDILNLIFNAALIVLLLVLSFLNINWLCFLAIFLLISCFQLLGTVKRYYIFIHEDQLILEHIFKKGIRIEKGLYKDISKQRLSIPFTNELIIHFSDGREFRFMGGVSKIEELDRVIKQ